MMTIITYILIIFLTRMLKKTLIFHVSCGLLGKKSITKHVIDHAHKGNDYTLEERTALVLSCFFFIRALYDQSGSCCTNSIMI